MTGKVISYYDKKIVGKMVKIIAFPDPDGAIVLYEEKLYYVRLNDLENVTGSL